MIFDTGKKQILFKHRAFEDRGCIVVREISNFDKREFKFKLDLESDVFKLDKVTCLDDGFADVIKFVGNDAFLFVFASEFNLTLTKSKYDILDETNEILETETRLNVFDNK